MVLGPPFDAVTPGRLDAHRHGACKTVEQVRSLQERPGILEDLDESGPRPAFGPGKKSHVTRALASWNRHASWVAPNLQRFGSKRKDRCDGQRCLALVFPAFFFEMSAWTAYVGTRVAEVRAHSDESVRLGVALVLALATAMLMFARTRQQRTAVFGDPKVENAALDGLPAWPGARHTLLNSTCPDTEHFELLRLHDALASPIVRTGPNQVHIADPASHKLVFAQATRFEKAPLYDLFNAEPGKANLFSSRDAKHHASRRRIVSHAFAPSSLTEFGRAAEGGAYEDVFAAYQQFTGDIISKFAFGRDDHMVENGTFPPSLTVFRAVTLKRYSLNCVLFADRSFFPVYSWLAARLNELLLGIRSRTGSLPQSLFLYQWLRRVPLGLHLVRLLPAGRLRTDLEGIRDLNALMTGYIDEFLATRRDDPREILHKLIHARDPVTGEGMDKQTLVGESRGLVVAGVETTAAALTYLTFQLATHAHWYERLRDELAEVIPDQEAFVRDVENAVPEERAVVKLAFFNALLKETFRFYPAGVRPFPRTVPPEGLHLEYGVFLPGGTEITCSSWVQGRWDRALWGDDSEVFRPERWIEAQQQPSDDYLKDAPGREALRSARYADMASSITTFSNGPRGCIGRNLATLVLHLTCASVFRCLQPGVNPDSQATDPPVKTSEHDMEYIGPFVGNPRAHKLELKWATATAP
ncbi:benzoate 4-monooxygenase cytochrome p450 [Moesziomyces aphidis]|uniref:Benzoate 4-monooxygenase cytochrome p450 n=1 Tax=Moesziomyces aphidis TaxID=84754 RepID=W3VUG3_MOEAP|nr:benzoate 4-monooxygenase cytochrome p450 [Moesziomyces aphidis]